MLTKSELIEILESGHQAIRNYVASISKQGFFAGSDQRWSPAHHLGHLTLTHVSVLRGFPLKDRLPNFDKPSRGYEAMQQAYLEALKNAPPALLANNPFATKLKPEDTQQALIESFNHKAQELRESILSWSEEDLDTKAMKHPVLGLLSVREMLEFVAIHDRHHLKGIKNLQKE